MYRIHFVKKCTFRFFKPKGVYDVLYNNKDIDAYSYTISELIYHSFMYQISFHILYEQN